MARSGMAGNIQLVREMTSAGSVEGTIAGEAYYTDDHIEAVLDRHRWDIVNHPMQPVGRLVAANDWGYLEYKVGLPNLESDGTVQQPSGEVVGTADYTLDAALGRVTFDSDTNGSTRLFNGRAYDVYAASAELLDDWAAKLSISGFTVSQDGQSFNLRERQEQLRAAASRHRSKAWSELKAVPLVR